MNKPMGLHRVLNTDLDTFGILKHGFLRGQCDPANSVGE